MEAEFTRRGGGLVGKVSFVFTSSKIGAAGRSSSIALSIKEFKVTIFK